MRCAHSSTRHRAQSPATTDRRLEFRPWLSPLTDLELMGHGHQRVVPKSSSASRPVKNMILNGVRICTRLSYVTVVEREEPPGGRAGVLQRDGFTFDPGRCCSRTRSVARPVIHGPNLGSCSRCAVSIRCTGLVSPTAAPQRALRRWPTSEPEPSIGLEPESEPVVMSRLASPTWASRIAEPTTSTSSSGSR
jgi:hypothetical protein